MSNSFETFRDLPDDLQKEAIREGEKLLDAQLAAATAADQRALAWSGFLLTGATAALGGGIALFNKAPSDVWIGFLAFAFAAAILRAAWLSLSTVSPKLFCFPGNRPGQWLPENWDCQGTKERKIETARVDQARHLDKFIRSNSEDARSHAETMQQSFAWAFWSVVAAGALLFATMTYRQWTIREPTSEIVRR